MASSEDLAKLVVRLEAQTAKYDEALKKSRKELSSLKKQVDAVANASRLAGQLVTAVFSSQVLAAAKQTVDFADDLGNLSQKLGTSVEDLSRLGYAAKMSATDMEEVTRGIEALNKSTISGANKAALDALGVSARKADGSIKSNKDLLYELADAFSAVEDGPAKSAAAMQIFGQSGQKLIPMLNGGSAALKEFGEQADAVGYTIDQQTSQAAAVLNNTIGEMQLRVQAWSHSVLKEALPAVQMFAEDLLGASKNVDAHTSSVNIAVAAIKSFISAGYIVGGILKAIGQYLGAVAAAWVSVFSGNFSGAAEIMKQNLEDIRLVTTDTMEKVVGVWKSGADQLATATQDADKKMRKTLIFDPTASKAAQASTDKIQGMIAALQEQADVLGMSETSAQLYKLALAGASEEQLALAQNILATIESWKAQEDATARYKEEQEALNSTMERYKAQILGITPSQLAFNEALADANRLREAGKITTDEYTRIVKQAQDELDKANKKTDEWGTSIEEIGKQAARNTHDALAQFLFDPFGASLKEMDKNFADMLRNMAAQAAASAILKQLLGGLSGMQGQGGLLGMIGQGAAAAFGGSFAGGGDMRAGTWNLVGEKGPELVYAGARAHVYDAEETEDMRSGRGGRVVNQTFNINAPDPNAFRASERQMMRRAKGALA